MTTGPNTPAPPTYEVTPKDTEHAYGHDEPITSTAATTSTLDTQAADPGGSATWQPSGDANTVTEHDSTKTNGDSYQVRPIETSTVGELDTTIFSNGGTPYPNQPQYRAPSGIVPGAIADTTRTGLQPGGSTEPLKTGTVDVSENDVMNIGAPGYGGPAAGKAAPAKMAAPTVEAGPQCVYVSWEPAEDPEGDKIRGYVIVGSTTGTTYAGAGDTVAIVSRVSVGYDYTFQIYATSLAGNGPLSDPSEVVSPYNPDEPDVHKPEGLAPENMVNPIYNPDGTTVGTLTVDPTSEDLAMDGTTTQQLTVTFGGVDVTDSVTYSSDDEGVATVSATGLVTAVAAGSATITVTRGASTATNSVTVAAAADTGGGGV